MLHALQLSYAVTLLLAIPAAGFLLRAFMIQHDCGHHSFLASPAANDHVGRLLSVLTLTPYGAWRRSHGHHHAHSSNLASRGVGDVRTLAVEEYRGLPLAARAAYRAYRSPLMILGFGWFYLFVLRYRFPFGTEQCRKRDWLSTQLTNFSLLCAWGLLAALVGPIEVLKVQSPIVFLAGAAGIWLFFVEHQFAEAYWARPDEWNHFDAALRGSSNLELPSLANWFTGDIALHHLHHLNPRVPNYRLRDLERACPTASLLAPKLSFREAVRATRLSLWDPHNSRLVAFGDSP